jgi:hypothetical protein
VTPEERAARLLRWYPKAWRSRFGDEFTELLISDICERPRSWARTADVVRGGLVARLSGAGLCGCAPGQAGTSLAALICAVAVFIGWGAAMWSQLTIGWQWSRPDETATTAAMIMMSTAMLAFGILAILAALPVAWSIARHWPRGLARPLLLVVVGAAVVFAGGRHFGNGWPGTGGHPWGRPGLVVPGGIAAFSWASTLYVSSYWAHPTALAAFPTAELAWMVVSPLALASAVGGAAMTVRRVRLSPGVLLFEARLGVAACAAMIVFLGGCISWVAGGGPGPANLFHAGAIDVAGVAVLVITMLVARLAAHQARRGGLATR